MQLSEIFRLVLINIRQNKSKVFLTSLGIIVGTATIVMVIAIGEGGKRDVEEQFKTLNAGTITISANSTMSGGMGGGGMGGMRGGGGMGGGGPMSPPPSTNPNSLEESNLEDILFFVPDIAAGAILATSQNEVSGGQLEEAETYTIVGTQQEYQQISNLALSTGSFITEEDMTNQTRCVVLGSTIATEMFGSPTQAYDSKIEWSTDANGYCRIGGKSRHLYIHTIYNRRKIYLREKLCSTILYTGI